MAREMPRARQSSEHNGSVSPEEFDCFPNLVTKGMEQRKFEDSQESQGGRVNNSIWSNII